MWLTIAKKVALPILKKYWKELILVVVVIAFVFNYWLMTREIDLLTKKLYAAEIVETQLQSNVDVLQGALSRQKAYIDKWKDAAADARDDVNQGEIAADAVAAEYQARIRDLLNKPAGIVSCEDNMNWMVQEAIKWK